MQKKLKIFFFLFSPEWSDYVGLYLQYQIKYNAEMYGVIDAKDSILLPLEYTSLIYDRESGFYIMEKLLSLIHI